MGFFLRYKTGPFAYRISRGFSPVFFLSLYRHLTEPVKATEVIAQVENITGLALLLIPIHHRMKTHLFFAAFAFLALPMYAQTISGSFLYDGLTRDYRLYIPAAYEAGQPAPLLLNLHGYGSINWQQEIYADFKPIADTAGFLIALPNGTADNTGNLFWNVGFFPSSVDDVGFLEALIDTISTQYSIDPQRIYSTGMSNGGFMSYLLACQSDKIAAIASVTGSMTYTTFDQCQPEGPVPVMEIHGTADEVVPYDGINNFKPIDDVVAYWVNFNECTPNPQITNVPDINTSDGATAVHYRYEGGAEGAAVEHYQVINGGHTWPGAAFVIGVTCQDFNACREIWRFFNPYTLSTGVRPVLQSDALKWFPNPATEEVTVECPNQASATLRLKDLWGHTLMITPFNQRETIDLRPFPSGLYFVEIAEGSSVMMAKVVKP